MNRRAFLTALGLAPAVAKAAPAKPLATAEFTPTGSVAWLHNISLPDPNAPKAPTLRIKSIDYATRTVTFEG